MATKQANSAQVFEAPDCLSVFLLQPTSMLQSHEPINNTELACMRHPWLSACFCHLLQATGLWCVVRRGALHAWPRSVLTACKCAGVAAYLLLFNGALMKQVSDHIHQQVWGSSGQIQEEIDSVVVYLSMQHICLVRI